MFRGSYHIHANAQRPDLLIWTFFDNILLYFCFSFALFVKHSLQIIRVMQKPRMYIVKSWICKSTQGKSFKEMQNLNTCALIS